MTVLRKTGDSLEGRKIICEAEDFSKAHRISTKGRHNAQQLTGKGNPARAIIEQQLKWV